jgi:hypothetical protein
MARIKKLVQGQHPTLLEAQKGNELIDAINVLNNMQIGYGDSFRVNIGSHRVNISIPQPPPAPPPAPPPSGGDYQVGIDKSDYAEEEISFITPTDGTDGNNTRPFWLSADEVGFESLELNGFFAQKAKIKNKEKSIVVTEVGTGGDGEAKIEMDAILVNGFGGGELELKSPDESVKIDDDKLPPADGKEWITGVINLHALTIDKHGGKVNINLKSESGERVKITKTGSGENYDYKFDGLSLMGIKHADAKIKSTNEKILGVSVSDKTVNLKPKEVVITTKTSKWLEVVKVSPNEYQINFLPPPVTTISGCDGDVDVYMEKS